MSIESCQPTHALHGKQKMTPTREKQFPNKKSACFTLLFQHPKVIVKSMWLPRSRLHHARPWGFLVQKPMSCKCKWFSKHVSSVQRTALPLICTVSPPKTIEAFKGLSETREHPKKQEGSVAWRSFFAFKFSTQVQWDKTNRTSPPNTERSYVGFLITSPKNPPHPVYHMFTHASGSQHVRPVKNTSGCPSSCRPSAKSREWKRRGDPLTGSSDAAGIETTRRSSEKKTQKKMRFPQIWASKKNKWFVTLGPQF